MKDLFNNLDDGLRFLVIVFAGAITIMMMVGIFNLLVKLIDKL